MKEYHDVMNTIKAFTADDAMVIVGTVIDDEIGDDLRVTMIATGLGGSVARQRQPRLEVVEHVLERTGTDGMGLNVEHIDYDSLDKTPAVVRRGRAPAPASAGASGFDPSDIPAFLRKQAD
jgi:cell division protein FtsZ